jgi:hypothetical protein
LENVIYLTLLELFEQWVRRSQCNSGRINGRGWITSRSRA